MQGLMGRGNKGKEKMEKYLERAPTIMIVVIPAIAMVLQCTGVPEIMYRDSLEMFRASILCLIIAFSASTTAVVLPHGRLSVARVCGWCSVFFFASALTIIVLCTLYSSSLYLTNEYPSL